MNFYRVIRFDGDEFPAWEETLDAAHGTAKRLTAAAPLPDALRIELFDVPVDKAGVLALLDGSFEANDVGPQRTWMLTPRKGLKEIANGE